MSDLSEIDRELGKAYGVDAWSDDAVLRVRALLDRLSPDAWNALIALVPQRPASWTVRLLDAAFSAAEPETHLLPLATALLRSDDIRVALMAAEVLEGRDDLYTPDPSLRPVLESIAARVTPGERTTVDALIARIPG